MQGVGEMTSDGSIGYVPRGHIPFVKTVNSKKNLIVLQNIPYPKVHADYQAAYRCSAEAVQQPARLESALRLLQRSWPRLPSRRQGSDAQATTCEQLEDSSAGGHLGHCRSLLEPGILKYSIYK